MRRKEEVENGLKTMPGVAGKVNRLQLRKEASQEKQV